MIICDELCINLEGHTVILHSNKNKAHTIKLFMSDIPEFLDKIQKVLTSQRSRLKWGTVRWKVTYNSTSKAMELSSPTGGGVLNIIDVPKFLDTMLTIYNNNVKNSIINFVKDQITLDMLINNIPACEIKECEDVEDLVELLECYGLKISKIK